MPVSVPNGTYSIRAYDFKDLENNQNGAPVLVIGVDLTRSWLTSIALIALYGFHIFHRPYLKPESTFKMGPTAPCRVINCVGNNAFYWGSWSKMSA